MRGMKGMGATTGIALNQGQDMMNDIHHDSDQDQEHAHFQDTMTDTPHGPDMTSDILLGMMKEMSPAKDQDRATEGHHLRMTDMNLATDPDHETEDHQPIETLGTISASHLLIYPLSHRNGIKLFLK